MFLQQIIWVSLFKRCIAALVLMCVCPLYCIFTVTAYGILIGLSIVFCIFSCISGGCINDDNSYNSSPCDWEDDECKIGCVIDMGNWIKTYYENKFRNVSCYYNDVEVTECVFLSKMFSKIFNILKCVGFKLWVIIEIIFYIIVYIIIYVLLAATLIILFILSCCQCEQSSSGDMDCKIYWLEIWGDRVWELYEEEICNCNFNWDTVAVAVAVELSSVVVQTSVISVQPPRQEQSENEDNLPAYGDAPPPDPSIEEGEPRYVNLSITGFTNMEQESEL